jgi:hypothetical protein
VREYLRGQGRAKDTPSLYPLREITRREWINLAFSGASALTFQSAEISHFSVWSGSEWGSLCAVLILQLPLLPSLALPDCPVALEPSQFRLG